MQYWIAEAVQSACTFSYAKLMTNNIDCRQAGWRTPLDGTTATLVTDAGSPA